MRSCAARAKLTRRGDGGLLGGQVRGKAIEEKEHVVRSDNVRRTSCIRESVTKRTPIDVGAGTLSLRPKPLRRALRACTLQVAEDMVEARNVHARVAFGDGHRATPERLMLDGPHSFGLGQLDHAHNVTQLGVYRDGNARSDLSYAVFRRFPDPHEVFE